MDTVESNSKGMIMEMLRRGSTRCHGTAQYDTHLMGWESEVFVGYVDAPLGDGGLRERGQDIAAASSFFRSENGGVLMIGAVRSEGAYPESG